MDKFSSMIILINTFLIIKIKIHKHVGVLLHLPKLEANLAIMKEFGLRQSNIE